MKKTAEELLQRPYWIIDTMPSQVPEGSPVKYGKQKSRFRRLLKWIGSEHYLQKFYEVHEELHAVDHDDESAYNIDPAEYCIVDLRFEK